jgi:hypothetical protein
MLLHPEMMLAQAHAQQRELIAEGDRQRLLAAARRHRRASAARRADDVSAARRNEVGLRGVAHVANGEVNAAARGRPEGTLTPCEPRVAVPARS